ncbi:hypothetical protein [Candidatus Poriferisodalis sp.]|uniref:hypothetical protein n=1 Tax=Candidatus Poriferisodalis sp. TaxID=3101277 RepID=UPI003B51A192
MTETARNRFETSSLCEQDVSDAIARIAARDPEVAREAGDVYESLTWGEGPGVLSQAGLQHWLWYVVPTKYITDEVGYMGQLAGAAAALLDELGLHAYAAICRSPETAAVHAAFDRSDSEGISALRKAMQRSGIDPPDLADFEWSSVMGPEEASARSAAQDALERAIAAGEFAVGGRGWRSAQGAVATAALDGDHPILPGQSWRTAVITERLERWIAAVEGRSEQLSAARARVANRLLHRVEPPAGAQESLGPVLWLLERFGDEQTLTQAGYLKRAFVQSVQRDRPWTYRYELDRPPRTETDDVVLYHLRRWLQRAGALQKRKTLLRRTAAGTEMTADWHKAWDRLTRHLAPSGWDGFVAETAVLHLIDRGRELSHDELTTSVAAVAVDMSWASTVGGVQEMPSAMEVSWALSESLSAWTACDLVVESGDWQDRRLALTEVGVAAALTYLRHVGAGPRDTPW